MMKLHDLDSVSSGHRTIAHQNNVRDSIKIHHRILRKLMRESYHMVKTICEDITWLEETASMVFPITYNPQDDYLNLEFEEKFLVLKRKLQLSASNVDLMSEI